MSSLRERLGRLRADSSAAAAISSEQPQKHIEASDANDNAHEALHGGFTQVGAAMKHNENGSFIIRRIEYPLSYRHGHYELGQLPLCAYRLGTLASRQNKLNDVERVDAGQMLFLDTETTGLGIGAGNVPFMIGFGYYMKQCFVVEQALIRHPGEEKAMLAYLLECMKDKRYLVTYNGRTFDWPVLANRFILNGWRKGGSDPLHLDFLHPSRALWRNTLPSCRLSIIEEARLGFQREDDVPGSLAPALYFQYLSDGDPAHLHGVYTHNERDILTLAALSAHFGQLLDESKDHFDELDSMGGEELFRTACWLEQQGRIEAAERIFDRLSGIAAASECDGWNMALAARFKRAGQHAKALPIWMKAAEQAKTKTLPTLEAHLELAIYYEHRDKNLLMALNYADNALELSIRRAGLISDKTKREEEKRALEHRISRLRHKASRERTAIEFESDL